MERSNKLKWLNKGGTFRMAGGKIIKPNETFFAAEAGVPKAFRDTIILLEGELESEQSVKPKALRYFIKQKSTGWFDVVDENEKVLNEKALRKPDAEKLLDSLK